MNDTITLNRSDLFDAVRAAIKDAAHIDQDVLDMVGRKHDEAAAWSDAHDRAVRCLAPLVAAPADRAALAAEAKAQARNYADVRIMATRGRATVEDVTEAIEQAYAAIDRLAAAPAPADAGEREGGR